MELILLYFICSLYAPRIFTIARNTLLRSLWYCAFKKAENSRLLEPWKKKTVKTMNIVCVTLSAANILNWFHCSAVEEIRRLRSLQNDLHNNWLYIFLRERKIMWGKRHYLCIRRNYNNCAITYLCTLQRARMNVAKHTRMQGALVLLWNSLSIRRIPDWSKQFHSSARSKSHDHLIFVPSRVLQSYTFFLHINRFDVESSVFLE